MIHRQLEVKAQILLEKFPLLVLTGPRQSGKTTLAQQLRPDYRYVNLELAENQDFAQSDPHGFLQSYQGGVILDEVQYVPQLFPYLKHYTDQRNRAGEYILTGSQHFLLMEKIAQSLAGRIGLLQLLPLSLSELHRAGIRPRSASTFSFTGGYPRIYDRGIEPPDFYPGYIQTYVERDVRQMIRINDLLLFRQFLAACAGRIGQVVNFSALGNILGVDAKTVKSWIGILEASFILYLLPPYHRNFDKRIIKSPKLYFYDTGLACSLLNIQTAEQIEQHFAKGALFENMILSELLKAMYHNGQKPAFFFWQDSNLREIDLLIESGPTLKAVEIKAGMTITPGFFKNLMAFQKLNTQTPTDLYLIYGGDTPQLRRDLSILPWDSCTRILEV